MPFAAQCTSQSQHMLCIVPSILRDYFAVQNGDQTTFSRAMYGILSWGMQEGSSHQDADGVELNKKALFAWEQGYRIGPKPKAGRRPGRPLKNLKHIEEEEPLAEVSILKHFELSQCLLHMPQLVLHFCTARVLQTPAEAGACAASIASLCKA